ncbi:MAG: hypothetical protein N3G78_02435 [Desulfobacterota bacterium]|nr:hypothetical protein [Thermodesulfobacteriota bacterium]
MVPRPLDPNRITYTSLKGKRHKVKTAAFARAWQGEGRFTEFLKGLPNLLAGKDFREVVERIARAVRQRRMVLLGMGAHPIKVGLSPVLIDLMERGILKGIAMNGACVVHDVEIAMSGHTSEEVESELHQGTFGMVRETHEAINQAIREGVRKGWGIGQAVGHKINTGRFPYRRYSLLAAGQRLGLPITVHVAIGTDIVHMGPSADGAAIGEGSLRDFRLFATLVSQLEKGVFINLGSAVILPEVFLKALALSKNLGHQISELTTVNLDFLHQYRPTVNVVQRPTSIGGKGFTLIGHHEIMLPLLSAAVIEKLMGG